MDSGSEQRSNGKAEKRRIVTDGGWPAYCEVLEELEGSGINS